MAKKKFSEFDLTTTLIDKFLVGYNPLTLKNERILASLLDPETLYSLVSSIQGYTISHAADTDHDITFSAGNCIDSTGIILLSGSALTKQIDASWSVGDDAGGLFSGSVAANTVYYMFVIRKDLDGSIDYGFDTSITAANRPAGYTCYRLIADLMTDSSSNIIQGLWKREGNTIYFDRKTYISERNNAAGTTGSRQYITIVSPPNSEALLVWGFSGTDVYFDFGEVWKTDINPTSVDTAQVSTATSDYVYIQDYYRLDASSRVFYRCSGGNIGLKNKGWKTIL